MKSNTVTARKVSLIAPMRVDNLLRSVKTKVLAPSVFPLTLQIKKIKVSTLGQANNKSMTLNMNKPPTTSTIQCIGTKNRDNIHTTTTTNVQHHENAILKLFCHTKYINAVFYAFTIYKQKTSKKNPF